ncbi:MAG: AraC family transcriptional regulator ligand-binding domain-containing protein [Actinomycetota bacterium]
MHDNERAVDANLDGTSLLANLMTAAAAYAVRRGVPLEHVADAARLEPHALIAGPDRVAEDTVPRILDLLQQHFPAEPVALDVAMAAPLHFMGPLEPLARLVPDLRAGIETFVHYRSVLATSFALEFVEAPPGPMLTFDHPNDHQFGALGAEMALAMGARAIGEVLGLPDALRQVWLARAPTAPVEHYARAFSVPVRFEAPANALLFHANRLDSAVDPDAGARLRVLRAHLELVREQLEQQEDPAELRRMRDAAARNAAQGEYTAAALASRLGLSVRTLQRRVAELDSSVSSIIDEVREATARQLLSDPDLNQFEIALTLGYSTDTAFSRAFRRWTGQSAAQYRRELADITSSSGA